MALGLISSETIDDYWSQNTRRRVFYDYPNGTAPLTGLLSMMDDEDTSHPEFGWEEKRWMPIKTQTKAAPNATGNKTGPFATAGTTTSIGNSDGNFDLAQWGSVRVYFDSVDGFVEDMVIRIFRVGTAVSGTTATGYADVNGRVTLVGSDYVEISVVEAYADLLNVAAASVDKYVYSIGSAYAEGSRSREGRILFPTEIKNNTQIFKTPFEMTRTALKEPLKYDKTGQYRDLVKTNGIDHLAQLEYAFLFGTKAKTTAVDPDTGRTVPRRYTGGLLWFLQQWEAGTLYGQSDVSAATDWRAYSNKRIIRLADEKISKTDFNMLNSRVFEQTNASDWSKLCLCGPEYLNHVTDHFENRIQFTSLRDIGFKGFNFELTMHRSNSGTVYYKTHPLFNENPVLRNSAFYIDLGYMKYRPLTDSDTDIDTMIQANDADKRKDQWLTEAGLEIPYPEAFMYVEQLGGVTI